MKFGTPKEVIEGENRVGMTPDSAQQLQKLGYDCLIESGAGAKAGWVALAAGAPRAPARAYQRGQGCCYMTPSSCKRGWHGTASFVARKSACPKRRSESFFKVV